MPQLHAALTDLVALDPDVAATLPRLPLLERLLSRAERVPAPADWRRWVLGCAGLTAPAGDLPVGRLIAAAHGLDAAPDATWFVATPVHLVASLTQVRFHSGGPLALAPGVAAELAGRFAAEWRDAALALAVAGDTLLLRCATHTEVETCDPAPYAGRDIAAALPGGRDAGRIARLMTELQMWLHAAPPVSASGLPANGLWLWGSGHAPLSGAARWPALATADPFLVAAATDAPQREDWRLETWALAELARGGASFADVDERWFAPLAADLVRGRLDVASVYLGSHEFRLRPAQRWRRWRRSRPWWELAA